MISRSFLRNLRLQPMPPSKQRGLVNGVFGAFAILFIGLSINHGLQNGFDRWIPQGIEYQNVFVAAAISDVAHGLDRGYIAHKEVYDTLRENGIAWYPRFLDPLGIKFPDNMSDRTLIDKAIGKAVALPGQLPEANKLMKDLMPSVPDGLAMTDFYKLGFSLFGFEVGSFFRGYYVVFIIGAAAFFFAHLRFPVLNMYMALLCAAHFGLQFLISHGFEASQNFDVGTIYSRATISAMGLIPGFHVLFALAFPTRFRWSTAALLLVQTVLFLWVAEVRLTLIWMALAMAAVVGIAAFLLIWERVRPKALTRARLSMLWMLGGRTFSWSLAVVLVGFIGFNAHRSAVTDPLYRFSDEFLTHHMTWHSIYAGLSSHPDWAKKFGPDYQRNGGPAGGDAIPLIAANRFLKERYGIDESYLISPIWSYKYRTWERITKEVYFKFLKDNPAYAMSLYFYWRPIKMVKTYFDGTWRTLKGLNAIAYTTFLIFAGACIWLLPLTSVRWKRESLTIVALTGFAAFVSVAPMEATFVRLGAFTTQILMVNLLIVLAVIYGAARLWNRRKPEPGGDGPPPDSRA